MKLSSFNSGAFADMKDSIKHSKKNKFQIGNVSKKAIINNEIIMSMNTIFDDYKGFLISLCKEYILDEEYHYRPELLSYNLYKTPDLWYLILWLNNISSVTMFDTKTVIILENHNIDIINRIIEKHKDDLYKNEKNPDIVNNIIIKKIII